MAIRVAAKVLLAEPQAAADTLGAIVEFEQIGGEDMVVLPERAVRLGGSGREILERCEGSQSAECVVRIRAEQITGRRLVHRGERA